MRARATLVLVALVLLVAGVAGAQKTQIPYVPGLTGFFHVTNGIEDSNAQAVNLASSDVTGVLDPSHGGTGTGAFPLPGTTGNVLTSVSVTGGNQWQSAAPTVNLNSQTTGLLNLATQTTGIVPPSQGGTGTTSYTPGGWVTDLDCDLTAQTTQTLSPDGNYTFCGKVWKKEQSAGDRVAAVLTNGTGLTLKPGSSTSYGTYAGNLAARATPLVWLALSQLSITGLDWTTSFRISVYETVHTGGLDPDVSLFGIDNDRNNTATAAWGTVGARIDNTTTNKQLGMANWRDNAFTATTSSQLPGTDWTGANSVSTLVIDALGGQGTNAATFRVYTANAAYSAGWPNQVPWLSNAAGMAAPTTFKQADVSGTGAIGSDLGIILAAGATAAGDNVVVTFARVKIEHRL